MLLSSVVLFEVFLLECILATTNIWFITFLAERLPTYNRDKAKFLGMFFSWGIRILVVTFFSSMVNLHFTIDSLYPIKFFWVDVILLTSGLLIIIKSANVLFFDDYSKRKPASPKLNIILLQGILISSILAVDAVRAAAFYINEMWVISIIVLGSMLVASWCSSLVLYHLHVQTKGFYLLFLSTGLLLILEALHLPVLSELICFGLVLYVLNTFFFRKPKKII